MKTKIKIGFGATEEELESEQYRYHEDIIINDYYSGRYLNYFLLGDEDKTQQQLLKEFKDDAEALLKRQAREKWVTGVGYTHPADVCFKLRLKGLFNKLKTLRIYKMYNYDIDELPF
jgi:hypothetical protein